MPRLRRIEVRLYRLRKKSVLHLILGGAAVHRCDKRTILNEALAAEGVAFAQAKGSVRQFVIASRAAGFAIHQSVGAQAHLKLGLAKHAEFLAPATCFRPFALGTDDAA